MEPTSPAVQGPLDAAVGRLVEKLRTRNGRPDGFGLGPVCDEAADELERLNAAAARMRADCADAGTALAEVEQENDLLRATLQAVLDAEANDEAGLDFALIEQIRAALRPNVLVSGAQRPRGAGE